MIKEKLMEIFRGKGTGSVPPSSVIAYHFDGKTIRELQKENGKTGEDLNTVGLVIKPGNYKLEGVVFDCQAPGNYYFILPFQKNLQKVVLKKDAAIDNALMLTALTIRGNRDDYKAASELIDIAKTGFVIVTCGKSSLLVKKLLDASSIPSRIIHTFTKEKPNGYNDSHTMLEVYDSRRKAYCVVDVDKKVNFMKGKRCLNAYELCSSLKRNEKFSIQRYFSSPMIDWSGFKDQQTGFNYQFAELGFCYSNETLLNVYRRLCDALVVTDNTGQYCIATDRQYVEKYLPNVMPLSKAKFLEKMYT